MTNVQRVAAALLLTVASSPALAQNHWVASWGAGSVKLGGETVAAPGVTYRDIVHVSLGGKQARITLSNRYGAEPLTVGGVSIARAASTGTVTGNVDAKSLRPVTFGGKPGIVVPRGAVVISDPVSIDVPPLANLAVSVFLPAQKISNYTGHSISHQTNYRAAGNQTQQAAMPGAKEDKPWRIVSAVDVMAPANAAAIVAFGDSITDGTGTTDNANLRWPNQLAARLQADPKFARFAVVDEGIGGNRILHEGGEPEARAGQHFSGLARWPYDALDRSGVKYVIILEGVNDLGHSSLINAGAAGARQEKSPEKPVTADDLIRAMSQMIDQAHAKGIKVIGATMTPYGGAGYYRPDGAAARLKLNEFIRHGGKFDGYVDFAQATADPANPEQYLAKYNDKDHLHPNNAGAKAMADSIDLKIFK